LTGPECRHGWRQLAIVLLTVAALTSGASHLMVSWLHIDTTGVSQMKFGTGEAKAPILVAGSSLTFYGISFEKVSQAMSHQVVTRSVPSASPCELEQLVGAVPKADLYILGVSVFDLNEFALSDFRADVTPLARSLADLRESHSDWPYVKRILGQYPLRYLRLLYPSAGRSLGVMLGLREKCRVLFGRGHRESAEAALTLDVGSRPRTQESIQDWTPARTLRNLSQMRMQSQGKQGFSGPKSLALRRMLQATNFGRVVVTVMPASPSYQREFVHEQVSSDFESAIAKAQKSNPSALWVRLDHLPELKSNAFYWDLVHLNEKGQEIATAGFLSRLKELDLK